MMSPAGKRGKPKRREGIRWKMIMDIKPSQKVGRDIPKKDRVVKA